MLVLVIVLNVLMGVVYTCNMLVLGIWIRHVVFRLGIFILRLGSFHARARLCVLRFDLLFAGSVRSVFLRFGLFVLRFGPFDSQVRLFLLSDSAFRSQVRLFVRSFGLDPAHNGLILCATTHSNAKFLYIPALFCELFCGRRCNACVHVFLWSIQCFHFSYRCRCIVCCHAQHGSIYDA